VALGLDVPHLAVNCAENCLSFFLRVHGSLGNCGIGPRIEKKLEGFDGLCGECLILDRSDALNLVAKIVHVGSHDGYYINSSFRLLLCEVCGMALA
jgi:hypothetical protein